MQQPFSCVPQVFLAVEGALSKPRLSRYLPAAKGNPQFALRLYLWNAMICESFYLPCQLAEVSLRNGIYRALNTRYGEDWHSQGRFVCNLPDRHKHDLATAIQDSKVEHGKNATADHIVARMPLGFWAHLFTKNFEHLLWKGGFSVAFPNLPAGTDRTLIHSKIERFRKFRNRTAHHFAIFDKGPTSHYADIVEIIAWSCGDTAWLAKELARVPAVINQRPAC
jgi:hypothetical protein